MHEKEHVIQILEKTKKAIKNDDVARLKELSNQTIHTASTEQDTDSITIAVLIYSLSKIIERRHQYGKKECGQFCVFAVKEMDKIIKSIKNNSDIAFTQNLESLMKNLSKFSGEFKTGIEDVLRKARINKASKIYEHGISMEQTSKLLGISMYELASYMGQKESTNVPLARTMSVKDRIKLAMDFFG